MHIDGVIPAERLFGARAGIHMWTAPCLQEAAQRGADRIACDHMSGLTVVPAHDRCQDGFRDVSSKQ